MRLSVLLQGCSALAVQVLFGAHSKATNPANSLSHRAGPALAVHAPEERAAGHLLEQCGPFKCLQGHSACCACSPERRAKLLKGSQHSSPFAGSALAVFGECAAEPRQISQAGLCLPLQRLRLVCVRLKGALHPSLCQCHPVSRRVCNHCLSASSSHCKPLASSTAPTAPAVPALAVRPPAERAAGRGQSAGGGAAVPQQQPPPDAWRQRARGNPRPGAGAPFPGVPQQQPAPEPPQL